MKQYQRYLRAIKNLFLLIVIVATCSGTQIVETAGIKPGNINDGRILPDSLYGRIVKCALRDKHGKLWFGTSWAGVICYDGKSFRRFSEKDGLSSNMVNAICEDSAGNLWFGVKNGVCRYDGKTFTLIALPQPLADGRIALATRSVESIIQDRQGNMWFGVWGQGSGAGVYRYDGEKFTQILRDKPVQGLVEDARGGIWMGNVYYDGRAIVPVPGDSAFRKVYVFSSYRDNNNGIWFGMRENVLYRYDGTSFTTFSGAQGLTDSRISCTVQDSRGVLWFGTDISRNSVKGTLYRYDGKIFKAVPDIYKAELYSIWCGTTDNRGHIWFGGRGGALCRYDGKSFTNFTAQVNTLK